MAGQSLQRLVAVICLTFGDFALVAPTACAEPSHDRLLHLLSVLLSALSRAADLQPKLQSDLLPSAFQGSSSSC